jgi:hypothetical protein
MNRLGISVAFTLMVVPGGCAALPAGSEPSGQPAASASVSTTATVAATPTGAGTPPSSLVARTPPPGVGVSVAIPPGQKLVIPGDDAIWVTTPVRVVRVDPETDRATVVITREAPGQIGAVGAAGSIWLADWDSTVVTQYDATGKRLGTVPIGMNPIEPVVTRGSMWILNHGSGSVTRIDPQAGTALATIEVAPSEGPGPLAMADDGTLLWIASPNTPKLVAIDPETNDVAREILLSDPPCSNYVSSGGGLLFVARCNVPGFAVFDSESGELVGTIAEPVRNIPIVDGENVWLVHEPSSVRSVVLRPLDPETLELGEPFDLGVGGEHFPALGSIWVWSDAEIVRLPLDVLPDD